MSTTAPGSAVGTAIGVPLDRIEGPQKVTGTAPYSYEHPVDSPLNLAILQSDEVAFRGQHVGAVVAETFEIARHAANLVSISYALHEESLVDPRFGHLLNHDFAEYHIPTNADVGMMDVAWIDEEDPHVDPRGSKGMGEIGIVGSPAAVYHATGIRVRDLPITPDKLLR